MITSLQPPPRTENTNRSLEKALQVVLLLGESGQAQGITDLCRATKFPPGTMSRIIATLHKMGFVSQDSGTKKYTLGPAIKRLSTIGFELAALKNLAQPILHGLRDRTGETSHLYVRRGVYREHVDFVESLQELRTSGTIGDRVPLHAGAASRVLWAFDTDEQMKALLDSVGLPAQTSNTIQDKGKLAREARNIRKLGYVLSYGERNPSIGSVAAPVFDPDGKVIAAISVSMPSVRFSRQRAKKFVPELLWATRSLGEALRRNVYRESNQNGISQGK